MSPDSPRFSSMVPDTFSDAISDGVFFVAHNGRIFKINPAFTDLLGYSTEDVKDLFFHDLGYERDAVSREIQKQLEGHYELYLVYKAEKTALPMIMRHKQGHAVPVKLKSFISRSSDGEVLEAFGIVTAREIKSRVPVKESEAALSERMWETEENYKNILEHSGDAIMIADFNTRIITFNQPALLFMMPSGIMTEITACGHRPESIMK